MSGTDIYLHGADTLTKRLLPGLRNLCQAALDNQRKTDRNASRIRSINAKQLEQALDREAVYSVLRDMLACQTWYEIECRGETYKPRGVSEVAHWWASLGLV